ncbi:MAG: hypothetical protein ACK4Q5_03515 [Saprospiraceae bacterium]
MLLENLLEQEQVILDTKGEPEYVVLPVARYERLVQMLEDFGLGQAMLQAEGERRFSKSEALALLEADDH